MGFFSDKQIAWYKRLADSGLPPSVIAKIMKLPLKLIFGLRAAAKKYDSQINNKGMTFRRQTPKKEIFVFPVGDWREDQNKLVILFVGEGKTVEEISVKLKLSIPATKLVISNLIQAGRIHDILNDND